MWLSFNPPPIEMSNMLLHLSQDMVGIDISVTVKQTTIRNKPPTRFVFNKGALTHLIFCICFFALNFKRAYFDLVHQRKLLKIQNS